MNLSSVRIIIPTLNAAEEWKSFSDRLKAQGIPPSQIFLVDSSSNDGTAELARADGYNVTVIKRTDFNHGGTRQLMAESVGDADILVYLTQDAIPAGDNSIKLLLQAFEDSEVAIAYGRQLPRLKATAIEAHARQFNYPPVSVVRSIESKDTLGFKSIFVSNSFAAYRRKALLGVGGFPVGTIFGEDTITAGRLLMAGWKIAYVADACVFHSHSYSWMQELRRYFDIGVMHNREKWMLEQFGGASGEGKRFVLSELNYLVRKDPARIPSALARTWLKFFGYRAGRLEKKISPRLKKHLSLNSNFWSAQMR